MKGWRLVGSLASSITRLVGRPPRARILASVVSKCMLEGTYCPGFTNNALRMFSAARPWCVGTKLRNPKISRIVAANRSNERAPAYDSSPCIMAAHCAWLIAPVPESVSRSIKTSAARRLKVLKPACCRAACRAARSILRIGSTILMRNGSGGCFAMWVPFTLRMG